MKRQVSSGFTLVEVLVAIGLMAVGLLAVAPLFTNSLTSNATGEDFSKLNALAKQQLEQVMQYGFDDPRLAVPVGATFTIQTEDRPPVSSTYKGQLYRNEIPLTQTIGGTTISFPYELVYTVQDYTLDKLKQSGLPNPATEAVDDGDANWKAFNGGKLITVYAASKRRLSRGGVVGGNVVASTTYSQAGILSAGSTGKQLRLMAFKVP